MEKIEGIKAAGKIVANILKQLKNAVKVGVSGRDLENIAKKLMEENKVQSSIFNYQGFPGYICVSLNNELTHGIPDDRPFRDGDLVSIDVACNYQGYHADAALTLIAGEGETQKKDLLRVTKNSLYYTIQNIQPNITTTQDIGATLEKFIRSRGYYPIKEYGGHIIGTSMHSDTYQDQEVKIFIPNYKIKDKGEVLRTGMFICIEPLVQMSDAKVEVATDK
ncbi:8807_t:CDS:1 [Racocetra persica]|uniref:8807_t:CDS:1 n=1 Tax=Racocetra persica TaxID=160502 RepID=A0ACA9RLE0_9GLOM|nr:8807_t:CDS:1 [Racocetra persica]